MYVINDPEWKGPENRNEMENETENRNNLSCIKLKKKTPKERDGFSTEQ